MTFVNRDTVTKLLTLCLIVVGGKFVLHLHEAVAFIEAPQDAVAPAATAADPVYALAGDMD